MRRLGIFCILLISAARSDAWQADPGAALRQGAAAMRAGKPAEAVTWFEQAVASAPDSAEAELDLGMAKLRLGEADDAAQSLDRALSLNPSLQGAHLFLGIAEYQRSHLAAAAAALRAELASSPNNAEALVWLGIVELGAGHPDQAAPPLDQAALLTPTDANVLYLDAKAHGQLAQKAYQSLYRLDPGSWQVHRALAENLSATGEYEKAIAELEAAIARQPANPDLYEELGEENQKMSRFDAATKAYEQELRLNPRSAIALYNLGKVAVEQGRPADGVALLQKAVDAHASPAPAYFYLGLGLAEIGRNAQSADALERSLASEPSAFIRQSAYYQLARVYHKLNRKEDAERALGELKQLKAAGAEGESK